jgi:hypothetical protein
MERKLAYSMEELRKSKAIPVAADELDAWVKENLPVRRIGHEDVVSAWALELWLLGVDVKAFVAALQEKLEHSDACEFLDALDKLRVIQRD